MIFLDRDFLLDNMADVAIARYGEIPGDGALRSHYINALQELQGTPYGTSGGDSLFFEWDNPAMVNFLLKHKLVSNEEVHDACHVVTGELANEMEARATEALAFVEATDAELAAMINACISTIGFLNTPTQDGGSVSAAIGYIYMSPKRHWSRTYFGEMFVHETVHNLLFLADMVHGLFPDLDSLTLPEAMVTSSIRGEKRPFDKSFHAACVSATLLRYNRKAGDAERANWLREGLLPTVGELRQVAEACTLKGLQVTTDLGLSIIDELELSIQ